MGRNLWGRASLWLLIGALVMLPFEFVLPDDHVLAGYTLTTLELLVMAAVTAWLVRLLAERRRPGLPGTIAVALVALLAAMFASALSADGLRDVALDTAVHAGAGALLFVAVADTAVRDRRESWLAAAIVGGAVLSATIGLAAAVMPSVGGALGLGSFTTTGAPRLSGTLDYPNTAAMYYEAAALIAMGLATGSQRTLPRLAGAAAVALLLSAMLLTLSRGAILGAGAGLVVFALASLASARRSSPRAWLAIGLGSIAFVVLALPLALARSDGAIADPPIEQYNAAYEVPATGTLVDGAMVVPVRITNYGSEAWNQDGPGQFVLGFHWLSRDARHLLGDGNEQAPIGLLRPGQSTVVTATVRALPPAVGHVVAWDVLVPGHVWLSQYGVPVATTQVAPPGAGNEPLPAPAIPASISLYDDLELPPSREELWSAALKMTGERPLLGHGPGTFQLRYGPYLGAQEWDTDLHANNTYLELAATTGAVGLALFLVLVALVGVPLLARIRRPPPEATRGATLLAAGIAAALVAFLVHGAVDYFIGFNPTGGLFWAVLGLGVAVSTSRS